MDEPDVQKARLVMDEDDLRLLIERTTLVETMTEQTGWDLLIDRAAVDLAARQKRVLNGHVTDLNEYKHLTGWIEGASFVLGLPDRMRDELDKQRVANAEREGDDAA